MIDRWHDPWVFFWIVFLYIVIHVAYGLWREDRVRKGTLSYYTAKQRRTYTEDQSDMDTDRCVTVSILYC